MKKISTIAILIFFEIAGATAQEITDALVTKVALQVCASLKTKDTDFIKSKSEAELVLGAALFDSKSLQEYAKNNNLNLFLDSNNPKLTELYLRAGIKLVSSQCPEYMKVISFYGQDYSSLLKTDTQPITDSVDAIIEPEYGIDTPVQTQPEEYKAFGKYLRIETSEFSKLVIKDDFTGKPLHFLWLNSFDGDTFLQNPVKYKLANLELTYYEVESWVPSKNRYVTLKILNGLKAID